MEITMIWKRLHWQGRQCSEVLFPSFVNPTITEAKRMSYVLPRTTHNECILTLSSGYGRKRTGQIGHWAKLGKGVCISQMQKGQVTAFTEALWKSDSILYRNSCFSPTWTWCSIACPVSSGLLLTDRCHRDVTMKTPPLGAGWYCRMTWIGHFPGQFSAEL